MLTMDPSNNVRSAPNGMSRIPVPVPVRKPPLHNRTVSAPSKLELIQAQYQQKLHREKEDKVIELYRQHQRRIMQRLIQTGNPQNRNNVREFFQHRRQQNDFSPNSTFERHSGRHRQYQDISGRPPLPQKRSAGRDKSNPLAPLEKPYSQPQRAPHGTSTFSPQPPPFGTKPKLLRSHRRSPQLDPDQPDASLPIQRAIHVATRSAAPEDTASELSADENDSNHYAGGRGQTQKLQRIRQKHQLHNRKHSTENGTPANNQKKLSDFEKWQLEQERAKEKRLRNYRQYARSRLNSNGEEEEDKQAFSHRGHSRASSSRQTPVSGRPNISRNQTQNTARSAYPDTESARTERSGRSSSRINVDETEAKIKKMEAELVAKIAEQQQMLEQMKKDRDEDGLIEEEEAEKRKQRQREQAERRRRLQQAQRAASQTPTHASLTPTPPPPRAPKAKYQPPKPVVKKPKTRSESVPSVKNADVAFYEESAQAEEAQGQVLDLVPCGQCGRKFAADRLDKHARACTKSNKKRKVFDPVKMRTQGTEMEKYTAVPQKHKTREKKPPKSNWRQKHEDFMKTIRYAKKVSEVEKQGGNVADLPLPPASHNPDYVQCPYCRRRFNETAADRHIPRCKDTKSRPAPLKRT